MARRHRVHYPGAVYHVITRGNNKDYILKKPQEKKAYIDIIERYKKKFDFKLYAYCIMDNHAHLLIEINQEPLYKIMQGIQLVYTQRYNQWYSRTGHVFEQRYVSRLCLKDEYLLQLIRYIHQNPLRAKITEGLLYEWSSHREYLGKRLIADTDFPLSVLDGDKRVAINRYLSFVGQMEESFADEWERSPENPPNAQQAECKRLESLAAKAIGHERIIDTVTKISGYDFSQIYGTAKAKKISDVRKILILLLKNHSTLNNMEIAEITGINASAVSNILNGRYNENEYFRRVYSQALEEVVKL